MRILLVLAVFLLVPMALQAQVKDSLIIELKSGQIVKIPFDDLQYITFETTAGVRETSQEPLSRALSYPNPSDRGSTIAVELARPQDITIEIANSAGEVIRRITKRCGSGPQEIEWDGLIESGAQAPSGSYFYSFAANGNQISGKLTIRR